MPAGFSAAALSGTPSTSSTKPQTSAPMPRQTQAQPARPHVGSATQAQVTSGPMPGTPDHTKSSAGGVQYINPVGGKQVHASVTGPGAPKTGVPGPGTKTFTDQYGRTMYYNGGDNGQPIAGVSAEGTVLRTALTQDGQPYIGQDGKPVVYDTGVAAFTPAKPASRPAQPSQPIAVGRPTQSGQPVSTPVVTTQPPPRTQDDIDADNQGRWLG